MVPTAMKPAPWTGPDPDDPPEDQHGGDPASAADIFGRPEDGWLDLSTGINRCAYPVPGLSNAVWRDLPSQTAVKCLKRAAQAAYCAAGPELIAAAPGTQAIIQVLPGLLRPSAVTVVGPTYFEHEKCWRRSGVQISIADDLPPPDRTTVVVNPNNPDGREVSPDRLSDWAEQAAPGGHFLIVDEAFADVRPDLSLAPRLPMPNVVVLRSFGKFYGLAGLRLGFALGAADLIERLEAALGPWAVSGPALAIGAEALADAVWTAETRDRLVADRQRLESVLRAAGFEIAGGTDLFVLTECPDAYSLWAHLGRAGILVRRFEANARCLRFGLPGDDGEWRRLETALEAFSSGGSLPGRGT